MDPNPSARDPKDDAARRAHFRAVFDDELDYVWLSLRRLGVHSRDLEDVAQDVFVRVHRHFETYDPTRPIRRWLFAFALQCATDWRRLARHRREVLGEVDPSATAPASDDGERSRDADLVVRALEDIEMDPRAVFILHELEECPMKEIAALLGIPLLTGYSRLRVAREAFTAAVNRLRSTRGDE